MFIGDGAFKTYSDREGIETEDLCSGEDGNSFCWSLAVREEVAPVSASVTMGVDTMGQSGMESL